MKKLFTLAMLASIALSAIADAPTGNDLLVNRTVKTLGAAKSWTDGNGTYNFNTDDLSKLVQSERNGSNIVLFPEGGYLDDDYKDANTQTGIQGFYIDMGSQKNVGVVYTTWEGAFAKYNIYVTNTEPTNGQVPSSKNYECTESGQWQEHTAVLPTTATGRYLIFEPTEAYNLGWGVKIRSISAYAPEDDKLTVFNVSPVIIESGKPAELTFTYLNQFNTPIESGVTVTASSNATLSGNQLTINSGNSADLTAKYGSESLTKTVYAATAPKAVTSTKAYSIYPNEGVIFQYGYNNGATYNGEMTFSDGSVARSFSNTRCVFFLTDEIHDPSGTDVLVNLNPTEKGYKTLNLDIFGGVGSSGTIEFEGVDVKEGSTASFDGTNYPFTLTEGEWNTISVDLTNIENLRNFSVRFDANNACDILLANIYFTPLVDESDKQAPILNSVTGLSKTPSTLDLTLKATDDKSDNVYYTVGINNTNLEFSAPSGETVTKTVYGLEPNTEYQVSVVVSDGTNRTSPATYQFSTQNVGVEDISNIVFDPDSYTVSAGGSANVTIKAVYTFDVPVEGEGGEIETVTEKFAPSMFSSLTLTSSVPDALTITSNNDGSFNVKGVTPGAYTLTATASEGSLSLTTTAQFTVNRDWSNLPNIATNQTIMARQHTPATGTEIASYANDGNEATSYKYVESEAGEGWETWLIIDLGKEYAISGGAVKFGAAEAGKVAMAFGGDDAVLPSGNDKWEDTGDNSLKGWVISDQYTVKPNSIVDIFLAENQRARYVAFKDYNSNHPEYQELYILGEEAQTPKPTTLSLTLEDTDNLIEGDKVNFSWAVKDQYDVPMEVAGTPNITVENGSYGEGSNFITVGSQGEVKVTAKLDDITSVATATVLVNRDSYLMNGAKVSSDTEYDKGANAIDGGSDPSANGEKYIIVDDNMEEAGEHEHWVLAKLRYPADINMVVINWEGSYSSSYDVLMGKTEENLTKVYSRTPTSAVNDRFYTEQPIEDIEYIKIVSHVNAMDWGLKLYDIKAYGSLTGDSPVYEADEISYIKFESDSYNVKENSSTIVKLKAVYAEEETEGEEVVVYEESMDPYMFSEFKLSCNQADAIEITNNNDGTFEIKGLVPGSYTLTATATEDKLSLTATGTLIVNLDWSNVENIATGKVITARLPETPAETDNANLAIDGNSKTYYEYSAKWTEAWLIVDLGKDYVIDGVAAQFADKSDGTFKIGFGKEGEVQLPTGDDAWQYDDSFEGWSLSPSLDRESFSTVDYLPEEKQIARYVAFRDISCKTQNPQYAELYISGVEYDTPVASSVSVKLDRNENIIEGDKIGFSYSLRDQYDMAMETENTPKVNVSNATYNAGEDYITVGTKGTFTVEVELEGFTVEATGTVDVNQSSYCMDGAIITTDTNASDSENAIDGGADPSVNGKAFVIVDEAERDSEGNPLTDENGDIIRVEKAGKAEHWILVELAGIYNLDLIALNWEGACPADYDVLVGGTADDLSRAYTVTGHTQQTWNDRFSGSNMNEVKFIKIATHSNATQYGLKLFEIKAYGILSSEADSTSIEMNVDQSENNIVNVYTLTGVLLKKGVDAREAISNLNPGIYVIGGKKVLVK